MNPTRLLVGAAKRVITPPAGLPMAGYAHRTSAATGTRDELYCRALVFADSETMLVLVVCDLLYATRALTDQIRDRVGAALSIPEHHVMVCATHTHSGPGDLATAAGAQLRADLVGGIVAAVLDAAAATRPARLVAGARVVPGISANRRTDAGPADDTALVVTAYTAEPPIEPIATIMNFACHATVLEPDSSVFSADFPGAVCDVLESAGAGLGLYLQGCAGDVNPVYVRHDEGECRRIGRILGAAGLQIALDGLGLLRGLRTINPSWNEEFDASRRSGAHLIRPDALHAAHRLVDVETAPVQRLLVNRADPSARAQAAARSMRWIQDLRAEGNVFGCYDVPSGEQDQLEVQRFHLGANLDLVALPGEPFQTSALAIRRGPVGTVPAGTVLVAGYANQSPGYLPPAAEFAGPSYEVGCCQYQPGVAEAVDAAAIGLLFG
jgi:neutral ceramidase